MAFSWSIDGNHETGNTRKRPEGARPIGLLTLGLPLRRSSEPPFRDTLYIEGLVIPLSPTTQHHHWPIGIPRDLHLLELDEGPRLATGAQGIQAKGLAFPRRHGTLGRAA